MNMIMNAGQFMIMNSIPKKTKTKNDKKGEKKGTDKIK